ncbi:hypothetical protein FSP39_020788 [Pinctada imbricata]|uniref:Uncharacterized protein n=1 Tax=Pinctada imbricata TaxID=66713 RepID=A0AA88XP73_PINIB|nr:hypothetical protein FSP39_020788 [Pinctada imbricata]
MVFDDSKLLAWIADGYKHKLFARDPEKPSEEAEIRPSASDNFALLPEDQINDFAEVRVITPEPLKDHRRVQSATHQRVYHAPSRPGTAPAHYRSPYAQRGVQSRASTPGGLRPPSGRSQASSTGTGTAKWNIQAANELRKGFTLVNRLYERKYAKNRINLHPAGPDPDFRYFDRHSRCYGYTHMHSELLRDVPSQACDEHPCTGYSRPVSSLSSASSRSHYWNDPETMEQPQRYINYIRPKSSPSTSLRGRRPRFCNIVRQKELHERDKGESPTFRDADYDYYRQHANGPLISRWRKHSQARSDEGGTEGRPGSPSSHAGDDGEDKENRLQSNRASPTPVDTGTIVPTIIDFPERKPQPADDSKKKTISTPVSTRSLNDDIQNTPVQPPPTPEPASPKEEKSLSLARIPQETEGDREQRETDKDKDAQGDVEKESKKRAPIQKKERKPVERIRKTKPEMEVKDKPIGATPPPVPKTEPEESFVLFHSKAKDITVELDLPSLPTVEPEKKKKREKKKPEKHLISQPKYEEQPKQDPEAAIDEEIKQRIKTFEMNIADMGVGDESPRKVVAKPAWVTGRLALSQQSSRFELPMDIVRLENMSPLDYIKEFCIITRRRKKLYSDIFSKHKDSTKANTIPVKELERAVKSVLVNTITTEHYKELADMLEIDENTRIDIATFSAISALAERLLCTSFMVSRDQVDMPQKEDIECADFSALDWKLNGVHVKPQMYKLLKQLS